MTAQVIDNALWESTTPHVSVLMPFLRDDPTELLGQLGEQGRHLAGAVEVVILDDGTCDSNLTRRLSARQQATSLPVRLITLARNEGRSRGRNRLAQAARGRHLLFLDSDMRPDSDDFLQTWLKIADADPAVVFGGFSLDQASKDRRFAVHRAIAARSECLPASRRRLTPEKYVYTSNLLIRRDVFEAEGFDPAFTGWGWEDVEWAMRVSARHPVEHIDNPATHMGLDTTEALAGKYAQSAANFARVIAAHPAIVSTYPSYRVARRLRRLPMRATSRHLFRAAAVRPLLPTPLRALALKLYRASLYAEVIGD